MGDTGADSMKQVNGDMSCVLKRDYGGRPWGEIGGKLDLPQHFSYHGGKTKWRLLQEIGETFSSRISFFMGHLQSEKIAQLRNEGGKK